MPKRSNIAAEQRQRAAVINQTQKKVTHVVIICEGVIGKKLLKKGDVTDDPAYVALLGDPRNLVRAVEDAEINTPVKPITTNRLTEGETETMSDKTEHTHEVETTNTTKTTTTPLPEVEVEETKVTTSTSGTE